MIETEQGLSPVPGLRDGRGLSCGTTTGMQEISDPSKFAA
jgi:hypothetical protein